LLKNEAAQAEVVKKPKSRASNNQKGKKAAKPKWAMTEKELEDEKEKEVDELLEFAYELDYEKYMDDYEVRQALAIIKDRVKEIKQDDDWKEKIAKEWNDAAAEEAGAGAVGDYNKRKDDDNKSVVSYKSGKTGMSK
jgi:hypothetical protein